MNDKVSNHFSEEDIRVKVAYHWLKDCGFTDKDIHIEYTIKIQLGKGKRTINSRTDILVKSAKGLNLLVIEVKKPKHKLKQEDHRQALSYARSLAEGGIAPFSILTNGKDTRIFDSVTGEELVGGVVPSDHPHVSNGFLARGDALVARAEALEYLISLSAENLLAFCKAQVAYRMDILKSDDLSSGKKYIPQVYIEREHAKEDVNNKLFETSPKRDVLLVVGPPQHGKTCFLCHTIEEFLEKDIPCLFYPSVALKRGLLNEIEEDFQWSFGEHNSPAHLVNRLNRILEGTGRQIVIFVDGWNEMLVNALAINEECRRLSQRKIKLVVSTTSPSLGRLLKDEADNLTYMATATDLTPAIIKRLSSEPLQNTDKLGVVQIGKFDDAELDKGKARYEKVYNVKFASDSNLPGDPFYLRLAAEQYANGIVPGFATRSDLIRKSLIRKGARRNIGEMSLFDSLNRIAQIALEKDTPFNSTDLPRDLASDQAFFPWNESAILISLHEEDIPQIDFYYTHDKDYSIAIINKKWHEKFQTSKKADILQELRYAIKTESGKGALRWFLSCPEYCSILERIFPWALALDHKLPLILTEDKFISSIITILADCVLNQVALNDKQVFDWLDKYLTRLMPEDNKEHFTAELSGLIYSLLISLDKEKEKEKYNLWMRYLVKYDDSIIELGVLESYVYQVHDNSALGLEGWYAYDNDIDVALFESFLSDENFTIAGNAAVFMAYTNPRLFLEKLPAIAKLYQSGTKGGTFQELIEGPCLSILAQLEDTYAGNWSEKGSEATIDEYKDKKLIWTPILGLIDSDSRLYKEITNTLKTLAEYAAIDPPLHF